MTIRVGKSHGAYTGNDGSGGGTPGPEGPPGSSYWVKVSFTYADFSTAGLSNTISLYALPGTYVIHASVIRQTVAFSGPSITGYNLSLGVSGDTSRIAAAYDVTPAPGNTVFQIAGTTDMFDMVSSTSLKITAVSTGANLSTAVAGAVDVWLFLSNLNNTASSPDTTATFTAGENLVANDLCYLKSDGKMWKAKADAVGTSTGELAFALGTIAANSAGLFLKEGILTSSALTVGSIYYISAATAGAVTLTAPSTSTQIVRIIGYAETTTTLNFQPDPTWIVLT